MIEIVREFLPSEAFTLYMRLQDPSGDVWPEGSDEALQELVARSLAVIVRERPLEVRTVSPIHAAREVLLREHTRLLDNHRRLVGRHRVLDRIDDVPGGPSMGGDDGAEDGVAVVAPADIAGEWARLVSQARSRCLILEGNGLTGRLREHLAEVVRPLLRRTRVPCHRAVSNAVFADPETVALVEHGTAGNVDSRTIRSIGTSLLVSDDRALLVSARDFADAALRVESPMLVTVLAEMFGELWSAGTPTAPAAAPAETRLRVLRMSSQGMKDEAISRALGISLRSVRRCFETLSAETASRGRFMLGVESVRRGWV